MSKKSTREHTNHFLVGQEQSDLGKEARSGKLPLTRHIMQYLLYRKNLPEFKFKPVAGVICCPLKTQSLESSCEVNPNCKSGNECLVWKVKNDGRWLESGIPILSDRSISDKIVKLNQDYRFLIKHKSKPNADTVKREDFVTKLDSLFDISAPSALDRIKADRLRSEQAVVEDIQFLQDQKGPRKMQVGQRDKDFDKSVGDKKFRDTRTKRMDSKAAKESIIEENNNEDSNDKKEDVESDSDEEFVLSTRHNERQKNLIWCL